MNRFRIGFFTLVLISVLFFRQNQAHASTFYRTLKVGMSGGDVYSLQIILNSDPDTRIQSNSIGSIGQESTYFGPLTRDAVIRFQEKHREDILVSNGLESGTGIVGLSTLLFLNTRSTTMATTTALPSLNSPTTPPPPTNPNLQNLNAFISNIDRVGAKNGISPDLLQKIKTQITKDAAATTTDLRKEFLNISNPKPTSENYSDSLFAGLYSGITSVLKKTFLAEKANAIGSIPFGGALYFAYPCYCSYTWLLLIEPLPPSYPVLLVYTPFSQIYKGYNIPYTTELLGFYSTGGTCSIYIPPYECYNAPSEGRVSSKVGSSSI